MRVEGLIRQIEKEEYVDLERNKPEESSIESILHIKSYRREDQQTVKDQHANTTTTPYSSL